MPYGIQSVINENKNLRKDYVKMLAEGMIEQLSDNIPLDLTCSRCCKGITCDVQYHTLNGDCTEYQEQNEKLVADIVELVVQRLDEMDFKR